MTVVLFGDFFSFKLCTANMVNLDERLAKVRVLVDDGKYFTIN